MNKLTKRICGWSLIVAPLGLMEWRIVEQGTLDWWVLPLGIIGSVVFAILIVLITWLFTPD